MYANALFRHKEELWPNQGTSQSASKTPSYNPSNNGVGNSNPNSNSHDPTTNSNTPTSNQASSLLTGGTEGQMTYYAPGLGACGSTSLENDNICAISHVVWDSHNAASGLSKDNPLCGHKIRASHLDTAVKQGEELGFDGS